MERQVKFIEVGPRDGFQSVKGDMIPTQLKLEIMERLLDAGVSHMEFTSFVSPKAIPQLADSAEVTQALLAQWPEADVFALVPNLRGAQRAYALGLRKVCYVVSLSASHNKANINRTHQQSLAAYREIRESCPELEIVLDLATAFGCPFEGKYREPGAVVDFLRDYVEAGVTTCCLCDTIGIADPLQVRGLLSALKTAYPALSLEVHFHDTRGLGVLNTCAALEAGVSGVQAALGGLGGCPFAPGASGNTASEDLIYLLDQLGVETGVDFAQLLAAAKYQRERVPGSYSGHHININAPQCVLG